MKAFDPSQLWNWMINERPEFAKETKVFITTQRITGELFLAAKFDQLQPNIGFGDAQRWALLAQGTRSKDHSPLCSSLETKLMGLKSFWLYFVALASPVRKQSAGSSGYKTLKPDQKKELKELFFKSLSFKKYQSMKMVPKQVMEKLQADIKSLVKSFHNPNFLPLIWLHNQNKNFRGKKGICFVVFVELLNALST